MQASKIKWKRIEGIQASRHSVSQPVRQSDSQAIRKSVNKKMKQNTRSTIRKLKSHSCKAGNLEKPWALEKGLNEYEK